VKYLESGSLPGKMHSARELTENDEQKWHHTRSGLISVGRRSAL